MNECASCAQIGGELQHAKMIIRTLVSRVNELKRLVGESNCENCELCGETINENNVLEHSCEDELLPTETIKDETTAQHTTTDVDINSELSLKSQTELLHYKAEKEEEPTPSHSNNESNSINSTNVTHNHKCNCPS